MELRFSVSDKGYGLLYRGDSLKALVKGKRQLRRVRELLSVIKAGNIDVSRLDDRFFAAVSLYLCEEKYFNSALLMKELRRIS